MSHPIFRRANNQETSISSRRRIDSGSVGADVEIGKARSTTAPIFTKVFTASTGAMVGIAAGARRKRRQTCLDGGELCGDVMSTEAFLTENDSGLHLTGCSVCGRSSSVPLGCSAACRMDQEALDPETVEPVMLGALRRRKTDPNNASSKGKPWEELRVPGYAVVVCASVGDAAESDAFATRS